MEILKGYIFLIFFFIALFFIFTSFFNINKSFKKVNIFLSTLLCYYSEKYFFSVLLNKNKRYTYHKLFNKFINLFDV
jgi:hypothetical protein